MGSFILTMLQKAVMLVADERLMEVVSRALSDKTAETEKLLIKYETEVNQLSSQKLEKYEAYKDGLLSREAFIQEKTELEERLTILLSEITTCRQKIYEAECTDSGEPDPFLQLERLAPFNSLTREMVEIFVNQIYICADGSLRIEWKYKDFYKIF